MAASSSTPAPPPPSSRGTPASTSPAVLRSAKFSPTKRSSSVASAARRDKAGPRSRAASTGPRQSLLSILKAGVAIVVFLPCLLWTNDGPDHCRQRVRALVHDL